MFRLYCLTNADTLQADICRAGEHDGDFAVEDAQHGHQRPKIEEYGDSIFTVLHLVETAPVTPTNPEGLNVGEMAIFVGSNYVLSVRNDVPAKTMAEFGAYARKHPGKVFDGTFGGGSMLAFQQFADQMDFQRQNVSYRGEALAINALLGGDVQAVFSTLTTARPFIESGKVKALGIPSKTRSPIAPQVSSADESGAKGFYVNFWFGLMAPKGTPQDVLKKIHADVAEALAKTEVKGRLYSMGLVARSSTPEAFGKLVQFESTRWVETARRAGIQPQ